MESIKPVNIIAISSLCDFIDLKDLSAKVPYFEYKNNRFNGCVYRMKKPKCTFLIFSTGKIVITGNKCLKDIGKSIRNLVKLLTKYNFSVCINDFKIINVVGSCRASQKFQYEKLVKKYNMQYDPELFPSCIDKFEKRKILVFHTGKIIISGCKSIEDLQETYRKFQEKVFEKCPIKCTKNL